MPHLAYEKRETCASSAAFTEIGEKLGGFLLVSEKGRGGGGASGQATGPPQCPLMRAISGAEMLGGVRSLLVLEGGF